MESTESNVGKSRNDGVDLAELFSTLIRFETDLWNTVDERLRAVHNMPLSRFEPMQIIDRTPHCRVNDIAEALSITVGGTSKLVDRLEASGFCQRTPDPDDGRSSHIELTPSGQDLLADATRTFNSELELRLGSTLSPDALRRLAATLRLLREELRGRNEREPI